MFNLDLILHVYAIPCRSHKTVETVCKVNIENNNKILVCQFGTYHEKTQIIQCSFNLKSMHMCVVKACDIYHHT